MASVRRVRRGCALAAGAVVLGLACGHARAQVQFSAPVIVGNLPGDPITEASGLGASRRNPGVLWTHNDSGDSARVFAIDTLGRVLGTYTLPGVIALDFEDLCVGPGTATGVSYVYVGDIGDNAAVRPVIYVHRFPEPTVSLGQWANPLTQGVTGRETVTLVYPDGPRDAEGLAVDPWTGDLFVFSKQAGTMRVYMLPAASFVSGTQATLTFVRAYPLSLATAADISADGTLIIAKNLSSGLLWQRAPGQTIGDALGVLGQTIPVMNTQTEPRGEAIAFAHNGSGYYGVGERVQAPLWLARRVGWCDGDFNADGNVDQDDIACLAQAVAGDWSCLGAGIDPDFNSDGNVDQDDVAALAQVVGGAGCP